MSLPYPGRFESHGSWMRRCDEYDREQRDWRKEQASRSTNWGGYNYRPVLNNVPNYKLQDGRTVFAVKVCRGGTHAWRAKRFALANGLCFVEEVLGKGITARTDGVAFLPPVYEQYNDDTPRAAAVRKQ